MATAQVNGSNADIEVSQATKLRRMLQDPNKLVALPGVYDGFSARVALQVGGWDGLYMTGAGTTASRLGHADLGIATLNDMRSHAEMIANLDPSVPLVADMDTGYGGPLNVHRAVTEYIRSGVAGFHIEDQVQSKRCGHLQGKELVGLDVFLSRVRAASEARRRLGSDIVIIARTDALQSYGYEESIRRLKAAVDAGADVAFLEGLTSKEMCKQVVKDMAPTPVLLNMVEHGATPTISAQEAKEMGFRMMLWPLSSLAAAYVAMKAGFERLKKTGIFGTPEELSPRFLFEVSGLKQSMEIDEHAGGSAFANGA
ncbi:Phosphoenolpyruvate/pyruvate domain-containing protein [Rhizodiscina lignyota]|uniref:Phosphoenolpyruvate/pyruvate domain-containing protein n=1 Tax=Rhizodiscina lignyota TaxID=1504668 RepID=A0A9P4IA15_9PEZI|nr:Phosphoenolpyruvate/pyruvate domain-containing protein [Rhizodiscina lignyota]